MSKFLQILIHFLAINILLNEINSTNRLMENFEITKNQLEIENDNDETNKLNDNNEDEISQIEIRENFNNEKKFHNIKRHRKLGKRKENNDGDYDDQNETDKMKQNNNTIFNNHDDDESDFSDGPKESNNNNKEKENINSGYDDDNESNNNNNNNNKQNNTIHNDQDIDESDFNEGPKESNRNRKLSIVHKNDSKHPKRQIQNDENDYDDLNEQNNKENKTSSNDSDDDESDISDGPKESHYNKMEKPNVSKPYSTIKINQRNTNKIGHFSDFIRNFKRGVIIGGQNAHVGKYPWAVFLTGEIEPGRPIYCGASIINRIWLLSAAHCFLSLDHDELFNLTDPNKWNIQAGNVFVDIPGNDRIKRNTEIVNVLEIILHPLYNSEKLEYDIALIRVSKDFKLNIYKNKIDIPSEEIFRGTVWPAPGDNCVFIGWGCTRPFGLVSERAQKVILPVIDHNQCSTTYMGVYDKINPKHEFCAGYYDSDIGICSGDSGSGLVCNYSNKFYLAGIASGTAGGKPGRYPAIFTRVSYFYNWIKSTIEK